MIKGERIALRSSERGDIPRWKLWFNDPEVRRFLGRLYPYADRDGEEFLERLHNATDERVFAIETATGVHIGSVGLHKINWYSRCAELGILIGEAQYHNKGYGTDAVRTVLRFAFQQMNLHRVALNVFEYNTRAHACYRKCGFREEGVLREDLFRDGRYWDVLRMGILDREFAELEGAAKRG